MLPPGFGSEADRYCVLELRASLGPTDEAPDAPSEIADAVSAVRLATGAPLAAGPLLFEALDGRPFGIRPVLPIAAAQPPGEPTRLDGFRGGLAAELLAALALAEEDVPLAEALDRWELALFQQDSLRAEQLRGAFAAVLGDAWPLRASVLLELEPAARGALHACLDALAAGGGASPDASDATRRALVALLQSRDRRALVAELDETLLGLRGARTLRLAG